MNYFIKIFFGILIIVIVYLFYFNFDKLFGLEKIKCNLENFNIDDIVIVKRTPEYSKLIDNKINEKKFIFTDDQLKILKNPQQIFNIKNGNISNISDNIYLNCKDNLDTMNDFESNKNINMVDNFIYIDNDNDDYQYTKIKNELDNDIKITSNLNCSNIDIINYDIPFQKPYLKNYYKDLYGNRINANLQDYFVGYYTLIDSDDNIGLPVETELGHSNFIIPDQYKYDSNFTNAYNIDWNRIINPLTYS